MKEDSGKIRCLDSRKAQPVLFGLRDGPIVTPNTIVDQPMSHLLWTISRICLAGWVGIATFFVVVLIRLRGSPLFSDETKLAHPKVLFPLFYSFEFWMLGIALASGLVALRSNNLRSARRAGALALVGLALLIAAADYRLVYLPLAAMIESPNRPPIFRAYHEWSRWLNLANLVFCGVAAVLSQWPTEWVRLHSDSAD